MNWKSTRSRIAAFIVAKLQEKPVTPPHPEPPSEMFENIICDAGTIRATCDLCGLEHFASWGNQGNFEAGELEELQARAKADTNGDRIVEWDNSSSVSIGHIEGKRVVWGCPCHKLRKYEEWIWTHRGIISRYLKERTNQELLEARMNAKQMTWDESVKAMKDIEKEKQ